MGRLIAGLEPPSGGAIELGGRDLATLKGRDAVRIHRDVQMMFQDSYAAMDPRMRIDQILAEPMSIQRPATRVRSPRASWRSSNRLA